MKTITIRVAASGARRLVEGLDSHLYWQLSDSCDRSSGEVVNKHGDAEMHACERLRRRILKKMQEAGLEP